MLIYIVLIDESQYNVYKIENENNVQIWLSGLRGVKG
jgi:hypothetical protein